ncbi:hypothetical protein BHM03_00003926 [Ensete ventricosum]|uniref:Uncharacterized protein n=1 Tax=Ensete ventricosum TaxID=4639 RepID=A0A445MAB1_ENSVE|nr:hypothetical protein BHM03_00003926 [Ensete ventricosum]
MHTARYQHIVPYRDELGTLLESRWGRRGRLRNLQMVTTTIEDAVNGDSYERWHRGKRKLLMCLVAIEEAADLSPVAKGATHKRRGDEGSFARK